MMQTLESARMILDHTVSSPLKDFVVDRLLLSGVVGYVQSTEVQQVNASPVQGIDGAETASAGREASDNLAWGQ
jgi:hypothetical protein